MPSSHRPHGPGSSRQTAVVALLLLAALALAAFLFTSPQQAVPAAAAEAAPAREPTAPASTAVPRAAEPSGGARVPEPPPPEPVDLEQPFAFALDLHVVDSFGLPVPDARVFLAPPACGFGLLPDPTDARGNVHFEGSARAARLPLWIAVIAAGIAEPLRYVELDTGVARALTVLARGRPYDSSAIERLLADGAPAERLRELAARERERDRDASRRGRLRRRDDLDILCGRQLLLFSGLDCAACHEQSLLGAYAPLQWAATLRLSLHPSAVFADQRLRAPDAQELDDRRRELKAPLPDAWERRLLEVFGPSRTGIVRGTVADADGRPAASVPVAWLAADGALLQRAETDLAGGFRLRLPCGEPCRLAAGGGSQGRAEAVCAPLPQSTVVQDFVLARQRVVRGDARDERGDPLAGWQVEYEGATRSAAALATTRDDGGFTLTEVDGAGRCLLWPKDQDLRLPVAASDLVLPDGPGLLLRLSARAPSRARLRVRPLLPPGYERARVELRVLQVDTGRGALVARSGFDDALLLEGLPAGFYRAELGAPGLGWQALGPFHLDGRGLWDLGVVALPPPGRVHFLPASGTKSPLAHEHAFYRRGDVTDVAADAARIDDDTAALPAARYVVLWIDDGVARSAAFAVESGAQTEVPVRAL